MSYKLFTATEIGNGSGEESGTEESVLDYTYISEDNFLLVILLTSQAHLLTFYKTGKTCRTETTSISEIFSEWVEPVVVALTSDASVVVLVLSNGEILLLPIRYLMDVTWGKTNVLVNKPLKFSVDSPQGRGDGTSCFRLPTSGFCFCSALTNRSYLVFSNKAGVISVVDLNLRRLTTQLAANESIHVVQLYEEGGSKYILATQFTGSQVLIPLQTLDLSVRETLAHVVPSEISSRHALNSGLKFFTQHAGSVCAINQKTSHIEIYDSFTHQNLPRVFYKLPYNTWLVYFSPKLLVAIAESNRIFVNMHFLMSDPDQTKFVRVDDTSSIENTSILGVIPVIDKSEDLEECLLVSNAGLTWLRPQRNTVSLVAEFIGNYYFSVDIFTDIAHNLQLDPKEFCLTIFRSVLKSENCSTYDLDGLISLAFELKVELTKLIELLNEFHQVDLMLPFLSLKCEKDPSDTDLRQYLFTAYITKLWRINQIDDNEKEKEALEYEIRQFLIKFDSTPDVLPMLMKQSLWSCVAVLLCKDPARHSLAVTRYLLETLNWKTLQAPNVDGFMKCLSYINWSTLEISLAQRLVTKIINFVPYFPSIAHLKTLMDVSEALLKKSFDFALSLYIIVSIRMLDMLKDTKDAQAMEKQPKLSSSSNFSVAIAAEGHRQVLYWGEQAAGTLRMRNEEGRKRKKSVDCTQQAQTNASPVKQQKKANSTHVPSTKSGIGGNSCVLIPKAVVLPHPNEIKAVQCGTEHIMLLSVDGQLYSWGRNRYGQCGNGTREEISKPTLIQGAWNRISKIHAGHYHSAFVTESGEVWTFGWGMYGQLGNGSNADSWSPMKIPELSHINIAHIALGYAHSLFQRNDGIVLGCGAVGNGQLGIDPMTRHWKDCQKATTIQKVPFPSPVRLISCAYFHGIGISLKGDAIYEWGECPQTLKMRTFLMKRLRTNTMKEKKVALDKASAQNQDDLNKSNQNGMEANSTTSEVEPLPIVELPRDYFEVRKLCDWIGPPIESISAGFNHSALITSTGDLYTWGKNLEMQLGHGNKKDKNEPSLVVEPRGVKWVHVECARNSTTAVTSDGRVYVWGRNDKNQLGLGILKKPCSTVRKIIFKATKGPKSVELPDDNHIDVPTIIPGLQVLTNKVLSWSELEEQIASHIANADQLTITTISRFFAKHPTDVFAAADMHILAGDVLNAIDLLITICQKTGLLMKSGERESTPGSSCSSSTRVAKSPSPMPTSFVRADASARSSSSPHPLDDRNGNSPIQPNNNNGCGDVASITSFTDATDVTATFDTLLDKAWNLVRIHPIREVQTMALLLMLNARFPIYNRLAADPRLCRLVDPYVDLAPTEASNMMSPTKKLVELNIRERYSSLKRARPPFSGSSMPQKCVALRQKCDQMLATDQLRFYSECCHYEKCVVESGPAKMEFAGIRNKLRKCTRCVVKNRLSGGSSVDKSAL